MNCLRNWSKTSHADKRSYVMNQKQTKKMIFTAFTQSDISCVDLDSVRCLSVNELIKTVWVRPFDARLSHDIIVHVEHVEREYCSLVVAYLVSAVLLLVIQPQVTHIQPTCNWYLQSTRCQDVFCCRLCRGMTLLTLTVLTYEWLIPGNYHYVV